MDVRSVNAQSSHVGIGGSLEGEMPTRISPLSLDHSAFAAWGVKMGVYLWTSGLQAVSNPISGGLRCGRRRK
ncbi:hypothetical protein TNCV_2023071 [Trichonephila clavipes]|nr:hypothetical protein TNCV_2023071 [Trichonephila clavipes]